ncbi:hypothetical protein M3Y99_00550600 [Aphelenchoides fujianensis]|nr:hypothetical protein M3Y99_00550600 [Aphelenchoides fujianensis]
METLKRRLCCCCYKEPPKVQESTIVINSEGTIITQPVKTAGGSVRMTRSNGSGTILSSSGFVNDAVDLEEIDLNERQMSQRSKDHHEFNNNRQAAGRGSSQVATEETIHVTGLMLDRLYESEDESCKNAGKHASFDDTREGSLSDHIVEEYALDDHNVITEASEADVQRVIVSSPASSLHRLTINLDDEHFRSDGALKSEIVIDEPSPAPRSRRPSACAPPVPSTSPPPLSVTPRSAPTSPPPVHEFQPSAFELGTGHHLKLEAPASTSAPAEDSEYSTVEVVRPGDAFRLELENVLHNPTTLACTRTSTIPRPPSSSSDSEGESARTAEQKRKKRDYVPFHDEESMAT